jgi:hypothetical protein
MILILILGTPILVTIMLLPVFIELKKPKDNGPRLIMEGVPGVSVGLRSVFSIADIEVGQKFDCSVIPRLMRIIEVLPSLEA